MAGALPKGKDLTELHRMGAEKVSVFFESWNAVAMQAFRANQTLTMSLWHWYWHAWITGRLLIWRAPPLRSLALSMLGSAMVPIHRRVMANVKRLRR
jgi:galactitol-specific phosphotransferase system IIC component